MKREKKQKKTNGSRKKWPVWLTILLVILGVGVISGITVLGVYIAGGFEERVINPESIAFSYEDGLYNSSTNQLEVVEDFSLTITSQTPNVTRGRVTLSFPNDNVTHRIVQDDGITYIDNGKLQVPEVVTIGQPFTVRLVRDNYLVDDAGNEILDQYNQPVDWIVGGISTLRATSEYNQIGSVDLQVAVDVPVYKIEIEAVNSNGTVTNQIVTGEAFTLQTKFYPAQSQYIYSDDANANILEADKRTKHSYYQAINTSATTLETQYVDRYNIRFVAGSQAVDQVSLLGYTFYDGKSQIESEALYEGSSDEAFYSQILGVLASASSETGTVDIPGVESSLDISISTASVSNFVISRSSISMSRERGLRLYLNEYLYDQSEYLGTSIYSTSGSLIENLLPNIAISFNYNGQDPTAEGGFISVSGGESYDQFGDFTYYKPFSNVANKNYCYWDISSTRAADVTISVALIVEGEDGLRLFGAQDPLIYNVSLSITEHVEENVEWTSGDIDMLLDYNEDGSIRTQTIDLDSLITIPENNIYKDHVFFAWFGDGTIEELSPTVDSVLGSTSYLPELSGTYATSTENLTLFALNGNRITLQNTGSFRLYFATIVTENGTPVYEEDEDGNLSYRVAVFSQSYITVNCAKSLNQDSVTGEEIDLSAFEMVGNDYPINQGTSQTIGVSFRINAESMEVFSEEYNSGHIQLHAYDRLNNDITTYINIVSQDLTEDDNGGLLEFRVNISSGANIPTNTVIYLSEFTLNYNNNDGRNISWPMSVTENVCLYRPIATNIEITPEGIYNYYAYVTGLTPVVVNQSLNEADGSFNTTIDIGAQNPLSSVTELLNNLLGANNSYVVIEDQFERTDTLAGSWRFAVESGNASAINLNGQTFTFRQTDNAEVTLVLQSIDGNATSADNGQRITLRVTSVGITYADTTNSQDPFFNGIDYSESDISNLTVSKYGAKSPTAGDYINLSEIARFYIGEENDRRQYTHIRYQLDQGFLYSTLTDEMIIALFGEGGMLTLYDENFEAITGLTGDAQSIRQTLNGQTVTRIIINKNFYTPRTLVFSVTDTGPNGAVNSSLTLDILSNISISTVSYPSGDNTIYAEIDQTLTNEVTNNYQEINGGTVNRSFASLYQDNGLYYVVLRSGTNCVLVEQTGQTPANAVGTFDANTGVITFYDFFDTETKTYTVTFTPEGENTFAISYSISFTITRNLAIDDLGKTYYVFGSESTIADYVFIHRAELPADEMTDTAPAGFARTYEFTEYLVVDNDQVRKNDSDFFFFDYNQQELSTTLNIYYNYTVGQSTSQILLSSIDITIKLFKQSNEETLYSYIASLLQRTNDNNITAQLQTVDNVDYIMMQTGDWTLKERFTEVGSTTYNIYANLRNLNDDILTSYLDITVNEERNTTEINVKNNNNRIFQGLSGDRYLVLFFGSSALNNGAKPNLQNSLAVVYVPLIITSVGYDYVNYSEDLGSAKLDTVLTDPNTFIVDGSYTGPYDTITAGQLTQILREYSFGDDLTENGLYIMSGNSYTTAINHYPLASSGYLQTNREIIKRISIANRGEEGTVGELSLNHLSTQMDSFYIALAYTISSISDSQTFYYVLKVEPDVIVDAPVYAYNGNAEYLTSQAGENAVELDYTFGNTTLNEDRKRFNVTKQFEIAGVATGEEVGAGEEEPITILGVQATADMRIWLTVVDGTTNEEKFALAQPYTVDISELDEENPTIDLNEIFASYIADSGLSIEIGDKVQLSIISGNGSFSYNGVTIFANLAYTNAVDSVTVGGNTYTTEEQWDDYISIRFSQNYGTMYYTLGANVSDQITIRVRHSYSGGAGDEALSVIGGDQYYTFILNTTSYNYSVRFQEDGESEFITSEGNQTYEWEIGTLNGDSASMNIKLLSGAMAGGSQEYTEVWNRIRISKTGERNMQSEEITDENDLAVVSFTDSTTLANIANGGTFEITFADYISSDREIEFTLYTQEGGYLATLLVYVDSTASMEVNAGYVDNGNYFINGGSQIEFNDLFNITLNGGEVAGTNYSVEEVRRSSTTQDGNGFDGTDFIYFDGVSTFTTADLIQDYNVTLEFRLTFNAGAGSEFNGKIFTFIVTFTLRANINYRQTVNGGNVIAGTSQEIVDSNIFTSLPTGNSTVIYAGSSQSPAFDNIVLEADNYAIRTSYISDNTPADIALTVTIRYNNSTDNAYQRFTLTYSIMVYKSVEASVTYPSPAGEALTSEYIEDGSKFESAIENFFAHSPIFGSGARVAYNSASVSGNEIVYTTPVSLTDVAGDVTISVVTLQNASVFVDEDDDNAPDTGENTNENSSINPTDSLVFKRGVWTSSTDGTITFTDNGNYSFVRLQITYQGVSAVYDVYIVDSPITVQVNRASENVSTDNSGASDYEIIYVDKTSTDNLFAQDRMANVTFSDNLSLNGSYYMVFATADFRTSTNVTFYASYPQYINSDNVGKTLTLDLGYSMANAPYYVGTYLVSNFETAGISSGEGGVIHVGNANATWSQLRDITNSDSNDAIFTSVTLANRVQLVYGDGVANYYNVDYSRYANILNTPNFDSDMIDNIEQSYAFRMVSGYRGLVKNDGSSLTIDEDSQNAIYELTITYSYMPSFDIDVEKQISNLYNYIELTANNEYNSMAELFGLVHPTSGEKVNEGDFGEGRATLTFNVVAYKRNQAEYSAEIREILNGYLNTYSQYIEAGEFKVTVEGSTDDTNTANHLYLPYSAIRNSAQYAYDYRLLPAGADNNGDFALTRITYTVPSLDGTNYTKSYYVVVKINSDYAVRYGEGEPVINDGSAYIANTDVYNISTLTTSNNTTVYAPFTLTSDTKADGSAVEGYVSVRHSVGDNTNVELATSNFTLTLSNISTIINGIEYNNPTNISQKLSDDLEDTFGPNPSTDIWEYDSVNKIYTFNRGTSLKINTTSFNEAKEVIFGTQYFYIEAVDAYGFTYRLYFSLQSNNSIPEIRTANIPLTELSYFDIGADYELLTISTQTGSDDTEQYNIESTLVSPNSTDSRVSLIEVSNIDAYMFRDSPVGIGGITVASGGGYTIPEENQGSWIEYSSDSEYLEVPMLQYLSIDQITFYDPDNDSQALQFYDYTGDLVDKLTPRATSTSSNKVYTLATANEQYGTFNGFDTRNAYSMPTTDEEGELQPTNGGNFYPFQVPRFYDTTLFGTGDTAELSMVIRLKYKNGNTEEYYDLVANVTIYREVSIVASTESAPVRDGMSFGVANEFVITSGGEQLTDNNKVSFINDTLEVLISAQQSTTFALNLYRDNRLVNSTPAVVTLDNLGRNYARTEYISLSSYLGINVQKDDQIEIIPRDEFATFYYVTNTSNGTIVNNKKTPTSSGSGYIVNGRFTISAIKNDIVYVEHANLLSNNYYNVTKSYIVSIIFDGTTNQPFNYRVSKEYDVTGVFYSMLSASSDTTMNVLRVDDRNASPLITSYINWAQYAMIFTKATDGDFTLEEANIRGDGTSTTDLPDDVDNVTDILTFSLDRTEGGSGNASIDEDGKITYNSYFEYGEYLRVIVRMKVSGTDRNITVDDGCGTRNLGYLRLGWYQDYRN